MTRFGRFALAEMKPDLTVEAMEGHTRVHSDTIDLVLPDEEFLDAVSARLTDDSGIDADTAAILSATP